MYDTLHFVDIQLQQLVSLHVDHDGDDAIIPERQESHLTRINPSNVPKTSQGPLSITNFIQL